VVPHDLQTLVAGAAEQLRARLGRELEVVVEQEAPLRVPERHEEVIGGVDWTLRAYPGPPPCGWGRSGLDLSGGA
jgi:hypothetical protein